MAYIEKEPIIEFITKGLNNPDKSEAYGYDAVEILSEIEYTPIADVVEVVRCKDCEKKQGKINGCGDVYCSLHKGYFDKDAFCSYGKRRDM